MEINETLMNACANRAFVHQYLWRIFADVPDKSLVDALANEAGHQLSLFFESESPALAEHAAMREIAAGKDAVGLLSSEYTKLFVGPGKLAAPLWESVYACGEDLVFQQSTLDVRNAYRQAGFAAAGYPRIPDDHIATEFAFLAALCNQTSKSIQEDDWQAARVSLGRQALFLSQHIGTWIGEFARRVANNSPKSTGSFYVHAANLAREVCEADSAIIAELLEACPS